MANVGSLEIPSKVPVEWSPERPSFRGSLGATFRVTLGGHTFEG